MGGGVWPYQGETQWEWDRQEAGLGVTLGGANEGGSGKSAGVSQKPEGRAQCQRTGEDKGAAAAEQYLATRHRGTQEGEPELQTEVTTEEKTMRKGPDTQEGDGPEKETSKFRAQEGPGYIACRAGGKTAEPEQDATHRVVTPDIIVPPNNLKNIVSASCSECHSCTFINTTNTNDTPTPSDLPYISNIAREDKLMATVGTGARCRDTRTRESHRVNISVPPP